MSESKKKLTLAEWQSNPALAEDLNTALNAPIIRMASEVIESMSPTRQIGTTTFEVVEKCSQFLLGKIAGYDEYAQAMENLRIPAPEVRQPREDYSNPNETK